MKAADFDYARAATIDEACRLLAGSGGNGKIIAGGQSLVPLMVMRLARPSLLVDIAGIASLQGVVAERDAITVCAATRQADALDNAMIRTRLPLLARALSHVGHLQTRNRGTVGGSLAHGDPSAEIGLAAVTLDAMLVLRAATGERRIAAQKFLRGPMVTDLAADECLTEIIFPLPAEPGNWGSGFQEVSIRRGDFALATAACRLLLNGDGTCRRIDLAVGGCGPTPLRLDEAAAHLVGSPIEPADIARAGAASRALVTPDSDMHGSADYRRRLAGALVERALMQARRDAVEH
jgi:CO/xanthine dehydrogenase FAD-binding subunit